MEIFTHFVVKSASFVGLNSVGRIYLTAQLGECLLDYPDEIRE